MMIGSHSATERESLIDGEVPDSEVILTGRSGMIVISIVSESGEHCFQVIPGYFSFRTVQFIGSQDRSTCESCSGALNIGFLKNIICFGDCFFRCFLNIEGGGQPLFHCAQFLFFCLSEGGR